MPKTILIRPVAAQDRPAWDRLFDIYADFYKTAAPPEVKDQVWHWILDETQDFWADMAFVEGHPLGLVQYQLMLLLIIKLLL